MLNLKSHIQEIETEHFIFTLETYDPRIDGFMRILNEAFEFPTNAQGWASSLNGIDDALTLMGFIDSRPDLLLRRPGSDLGQTTRIIGIRRKEPLKAQVRR